MTTLKLAIANLLENFWDERAVEGPTTMTVDGLGPPLDSLTACEVLIDIDAIVGFAVPVGVVIRAGGYTDKTQFVSELTAAVIEQVEKQPA